MIQKTVADIWSQQFKTECKTIYLFHMKTFYKAVNNITLTCEDYDQTSRKFDL